MTCYGFILVDEISEKDVYDFLRKGLMRDYDDVIPVRGPKEFWLICGPLDDTTI